MGLKVLLLACLRLSILAAAQTVTWTTIPNILSAHSELSTLSSLVNSLPLLVQQFNSADNFTFLAPTNTAISSWLATNRSTDYIQAALQYHLLKGTYPSVSIPSVPVFIPSSLTNTSYCNITGGQRVKASNTNGNLVFGSALQTTSNALSVDLIAVGGVVHTIDKVLELPIGPIQTFTAENLSYFLTLGNEGGFLSAESFPFVDTFFSNPDVTYFIANSAKAVADFNMTGLNQTTLLQSINYPVAPRIIYSTGLIDGTQVASVMGPPILITVHDGDIYVDRAKVTSRDNFVSNGVFHVIDDVLDPRNISRPSFASNASTTSPTIQPTDLSAAQGHNQLSTGARIGIGLGTIGSVILVITASIFLYCRKRNSSTSADRKAGNLIGRDKRELGEHELSPLGDRESTVELSTNSPHEFPQLATTESPVELPTGYVFHQQIGRAF